MMLHVSGCLGYIQSPSAEYILNLPKATTIKDRQRATKYSLCTEYGLWICPATQNNAKLYNQTRRTSSANSADRDNVDTST
jgi:hypothetical protein